MSKIITRAEYMRNSKELHQAYFIQFATAQTRNIVKNLIGEKDIKASTDPHFNDIPLQRWDNINDSVKHSVNRQAKKDAQEYGKSDGKFYWCTNDGTCIAKAVAREIRGF